MKTKALFLLTMIWVTSVGLAYWIGANRVTPTITVHSESNVNKNPNDISSKQIFLNNTKQEQEIIDSNSESETADLKAPTSIIEDLELAFAMPLSNPKKQGKINELLKELAQSDPLKAMEYANSIPSLRAADEARQTILETWASTDPQAALLWASTALSELPINRQQAQMMAIIRGYAAHNPQAALQYTLTMDTDTPNLRRSQSRLATEVIETQIRNGGLAAAKLTIESLEDGTLKQNMLREMVDEWAQFDPESAASYVTGLGVDAPTNLKTALIGEWSEIDPQAAADWVSSLPSGDPAIARSTAEVIRKWARYDLTASAKWLNSLPSSPDLDRAISSYTWRATEEDPGSAMSWAESINNEWMRERSMGRVAAQWNTEDPDSFTAYIENSNFDEAAKKKLIEASANTRDRRRNRR